MISSLVLADDFARILPVDELFALAAEQAATRTMLLCSAIPDGLAELRRDRGDVAAEAVARELVTLLRRNLRGTDAVASRDSELVLLLDSPRGTVNAIMDRLRSAIRAHVFASGAAEGPARLTLSIGVCATPERDVDVARLYEDAREARRSAGVDGCAVVSDEAPTTLDVGRFVGRTEELLRLTDYLDDMVRGAGRVLAVMGETGVGSTALVRAIEPEVRLRGGSLVIGTCREHFLPSPYALWCDVLRGVRRLPVKSTRLWRELPALDGTLERLVDDSGGGSKSRLFEELADFLRLAAQQRPLVILLDNLQWADPASWDALEYLITQLESERILLVLTFQTGASSDDALDRWARLASRPRHHEVRLTRLTRDDVKRWLEGAMRSGEPGRDLLAYIYRHTEGRPLLLAHLLRDLEEGGHIVRQANGWRWTPVAELPAVGSIDALIGRRLDRLAAPVRAMLDVAAMLGREADVALLAATAGVSIDEARPHLMELVGRGFLVASYDRDAPTYLFAHDEIIRVGRALLSPEERATLHGRVARALAARLVGSATEIAAHFELAGERTEAHRYAIKGASDAEKVHETHAVAALLAAAERNAPSPEALADIRVRMASLAEIAGRYEEAEALCDQALAWYESQGEAIPTLRLKRTRALVRMQRGQAARDTLETLLALEAEARTVNADAERAAILLLISQTHWRLGDPRAAQRVAAECVEIAERVGDPVLIADSCNRLAVTIQLENAPRARELFDRSLEIGASLGDAFRRVRCLNNIGVLELISNNWDEARRVLKMAADQARTAGLTEAWGRAELNLGVLAGRIGDHDGAARALSEALRLTSMVQNSEEQLYATYNMAHLERERDHLREAIDTYELVTELAERIGQVEVHAGALAGMGLCRFMLGDLDGARRALHDAMPFVERLEDWFQGRELLAGLRIHLMLVDGNIEGAGRLFERALTLSAPSDVYGASWLTAEFGEELRPHFPQIVDAAVQEYASRPEVLGNPRIRERFTVLKIDS